MSSEQPSDNMRHLRKHILLPIVALILASCSNDEAEVIPRGKLADIYAEMLMTDQWISSTPGVRMIADTSLVYEPILEKYGYDKYDYVKSVDHYMNDPERFSRILRTSAERLDKRLAELKKLKQRQELENEALKNVLKHQTDYSFDEYFPYLHDEPYVHYYDSLTFEPDSFRVYCLVPIERADTLYDRIRMIIRDSLAVSDTLAMTDSLAVADSLVLEDPVKDSVTVKKPVRPVKVDDRQVSGKRPVPILKDTLPGGKGLKNNMKWQVKE